MGIVGRISAYRKRLIRYVMLTNGSGPLLSRFNPYSGAGPTEHRAVALVGPVVEDLDDLKADGSELLG